MLKNRLDTPEKRNEENLFWNFIKNDLQFYVFSLAVFLIPFPKVILPYIMFLWILSGFLSIRKIRYKDKREILLLIFPLVVYIVHIIGLFYSSDLDKGLFNLEVKLSLLFLPMVGYFITKKVRANYKLILTVFIISNFIVSIICFIQAIDNSLFIDEFGNYIFEPSVWPKVTQGLSFVGLINSRYSYFSYGFLSIFHHSSYYSMYILFSIWIIVYFIRIKQLNRVICYALLIYFSIFLWLLGSRAALLTYLLSISTFLLIVIFNDKKYKLGLILIIMISLISLFVLTNKYIKYNIKETIELTGNKSLNEKSDERLWLWKSGIEIFNENFWFGVGTGDIDAELKNKYKKYQLQTAADKNLNVHNQYLDIAIKFGIFGLLIFISWMIYSLIISIKKRQFLFLFFLIILFINFFFEVILNSIAGISFFVVFYSLFYSLDNKRT